MYKKTKISIILCLMLSLLVGCSDQDKRENTALALVEDIVTQNYDSLKNSYEYDENMKAFINQEKLAETLESSFIGYGNFVELSDEVISQDNTYIVSIKMENGNLKASVAFQGENQVCGLYLSPDMTQTAPIPDGITELELNLKAQDGLSMGGILCLPQGTGPFPTVIFVHGSGPCDKEETIGANQVFKDLAMQLAQNGIASYRYDKRTYVDREIDVSFTIQDEVTNDVLDAITLLKENEYVDGSKLYVLGHSLGAQMVPMIAQETSDVKGWIMMAPPARQLQDLMIEQANFLAELDGNVDDNEAVQIQIIEGGIESIKRLGGMEDDELVLGGYKAYWQSLKEYDQVDEARYIEEPVLLLQGEEDYQVTMTDFEMWQDAFEGNDLWTFKSFKGLTHTMMPGSKNDGAASYNIPSHISSDVIQSIKEFILK